MWCIVMWFAVHVNVGAVSVQIVSCESACKKTVRSSLKYYRCMSVVVFHWRSLLSSAMHFVSCLFSLAFCISMCLSLSRCSYWCRQHLEIFTYFIICPTVLCSFVSLCAVLQLGVCHSFTCNKFCCCVTCNACYCTTVLLFLSLSVFTRHWFLCLRWQLAAKGILFRGCPWVCDRMLKICEHAFYGAVGDKDEMIGVWGQEVSGQG